MVPKKPWQPRIDKDPELNPSVRSTEPTEEDEPTLEDIEAESEEGEAREDDPEPIKIPHRTP
jgi:hypothetical protein